MLLAGWMVYYGRPWREVAALVWTLAASEAVGVMLAGMLHHRHIEPVRAATWPFGFAGLIPLRAAAVWGMTGHLMIHQMPRWRRATGLLILGAGFGVVWNGEQMVTEAILEGAAGGLVFLSGIWWLHGFGPGLLVRSQPLTPVHP
jgi:hypothetical protein